MQRWGVAGETQTFAGFAANILLKVPAMVASLPLMAGSKFKDLAKSAPVQTVKGKTIYIMRDVIQEAKRGASKIKDPQELRRLSMMWNSLLPPYKTIQRNSIKKSS